MYAEGQTEMEIKERCCEGTDGCELTQNGVFLGGKQL